MQSNFKRVVGAVMAIVGFVLLSAQGCDGPAAKSDTHLVLDVSGPPLAQTYGCPAGKWFLSVVDRKIADNKQLSPDEKAAAAKKICETKEIAAKYTVGGYWP